mgnify:CR=1 FL=1
MTVDKVIHKDASKGLVLNARLLWTFAGAYRIFGDEKYKELADRAFNYIVERFWDHKNGGGFWMRRRPSEKNCTADYNPKVYADEQSETSEEVSLFL